MTHGQSLCFFRGSNLQRLMKKTLLLFVENMNAPAHLLKQLPAPIGEKHSTAAGATQLK